MDAPDTPQPKTKNEGGIGPMAGIIIVVILLALGGLYFLLEESARVHAPPLQENLNA
jgi:hypothetical protein